MENDLDQSEKKLTPLYSLPNYFLTTQKDHKVRTVLQYKWCPIAKPVLMINLCRTEKSSVIHWSDGFRYMCRERCLMIYKF